MNMEKELSHLLYSVLMSVYEKDKPKYLEASIESMLNQTVLPEQFVIVLDGPVPKEIHKVIEKYVVDRKRFTLVELSQNNGLGRALDIGLIECRNELVARMDADDISLPRRCEKELALFLENKDLALCGSNIEEFYNDPENVRTIRRVPSDYESIRKFIRRRQPFNHPTVMFKKSEVIRCGGYGGLKRKQDYDLFSRMINMGCYALNIDEVLLKFRADESSYKRRKSWSYVKSSIKVGVLNYQRRYCSFWDLMYIVCGQIGLFLMPLKMMTFVSDMMLREKYMYKGICIDEKKSENYVLYSKNE